ncbi:unnamed protein product, partial [Prorocentrum cordatum]
GGREEEEEEEEVGGGGGGGGGGRIWPPRQGAQILKQAPVAGRQPRMHKASRHGGRPMRVAAPLALPRSLAGLRWIGSLNHVYCEAPSGAGRRMDLCRGRNNGKTLAFDGPRGPSKVYSGGPTTRNLPRETQP